MSVGANFNFKGNNLYWQSWEAPQTNALIFIIHGMGEHGGRYEHVAKFFNQFNYTVCAIDHFGHGKSDGKRGHISNLNFMYEYMEMFFNEVYKKYGQKPAVLYGHSMGGNAVANYLILKKQNFKAAIITSPWFLLPDKIPFFKHVLARLMMKIYPAYQDHTNLLAWKISRDQEEVKKYMNDPLVHDFMTPSFFFQMRDAGVLAIDYAERIKIPVLLMHGTADQITSYAGSEMFFENNTEYITFKSWEGGYHELHNDIIKEDVLESMIDWLAARMM